ncbi:hypothetical protein K502DRAFT_190286 [Neoconidiobolus thromboides FSU 785]|nr:hypothetical protein K502DRAFT_190286 [Neoconidiobolus thromboides FSU 785]
MYSINLLQCWSRFFAGIRESELKAKQKSEEEMSPDKQSEDSYLLKEKNSRNNMDDTTLYRDSEPLAAKKYSLGSNATTIANNIQVASKDFKRNANNIQEVFLTPTTKLVDQDTGNATDRMRNIQFMLPTEEYDPTLDSPSYKIAGNNELIYRFIKDPENPPTEPEKDQLSLINSDSSKLKLHPKTMVPREAKASAIEASKTDVSSNELHITKVPKNQPLRHTAFGENVRYDQSVDNSIYQSGGESVIQPLRSSLFEKNKQYNQNLNYSISQSYQAVESNPASSAFGGDRQYDQSVNSHIAQSEKTVENNLPPSIFGGNEENDQKTNNLVPQSEVTIEHDLPLSIFGGDERPNENVDNSILQSDGTIERDLPLSIFGGSEHQNVNNLVPHSDGTIENDLPLSIFGNGPLETYEKTPQINQLISKVKNDRELSSEVRENENNIKTESAKDPINKINKPETSNDQEKEVNNNPEKLENNIKESNDKSSDDELTDENLDGILNNEISDDEINYEFEDSHISIFDKIKIESFNEENIRALAEEEERSKNFTIEDILREVQGEGYIEEDAYEVPTFAEKVRKMDEIRMKENNITRDELYDKAANIETDEEDLSFYSASEQTFKNTPQKKNSDIVLNKDNQIMNESIQNLLEDNKTNGSIVKDKSSSPLEDNGRIKGPVRKAVDIGLYQKSNTLTLPENSNSLQRVNQNDNNNLVSTDEIINPELTPSNKNYNKRYQFKSPTKLFRRSIKSPRVGREVPKTDIERVKGKVITDVENEICTMLDEKPNKTILLSTIYQSYPNINQETVDLAIKNLVDNKKVISEDSKVTRAAKNWH